MIKKLQELAKLLGRRVEPTSNDPNAVHVYYPKNTPNYTYGGAAIISIEMCAKQLEIEYRRLAEEEETRTKILKSRYPNKGLVGSAYLFTAIADELRDMVKTEKTQLEKDVEILNRMTTPNNGWSLNLMVIARTILYIIEQLKKEKSNEVL